MTYREVVVGGYIALTFEQQSMVSRLFTMVRLT